MNGRHTISPEYQIKQAREVKRLRAENARMRALLALVQNCCHGAHHGIADRHDLGTPCPIEGRVRAIVLSTQRKDRPA